MPPKFDAAQNSNALGTPRGMRIVDISAADFEDATGFFFHVNGAGDVTFRPANSDADVTINGLAAGEYPQVCGLPALATAVRMSAAIAAITVGYW